MNQKKMPGFTAEASLAIRPTPGKNHMTAGRGRSPATSIAAVTPQLNFRFGGDPDIGDYLRCIKNGGGELVCRFFGGLPPFNIGLLRFR